MKILLLNDQAARSGGAELLTLALRDGLRALGFDARIFASTAASNPDSCFADYTCFGTTSAVRTLNRTVNIDAYRQLKRVLDEFRPDVVHVRMFLTQLSPLVLPLLRDVPSVYHASWYAAVCPNGLKLLPNHAVCEDRAGTACFRNGCLSAPAWAVLMLQRRLLLRWRGVFDAVVANSAAVRRQLVGDGIEPVQVIWNGVAERPARPELLTPPTVAYAGRLSWEKGVDVLLRAFRKVIDRLDARLLIAGDGPQRPALLELTAELGLDRYVVFLGHLDQQRLERRLAPAWVQVVPSRLAEPFGLAAAEAMMRGTAVVASDTGGLAEIVQNGQTGLSVPPSDDERLARALCSVLTDRPLAEQMGAAARRRARRYFSQQRFVDQFVTLYRKLSRQADPP